MPNFNRWKFRKLKIVTVKRECDTCRKQHTMECPESAYCYDRDDHIHWEGKSKS